MTSDYSSSAHSTTSTSPPPSSLPSNTIEYLSQAANRVPTAYPPWAVLSLQIEGSFPRRHTRSSWNSYLKSLTRPLRSVPKTALMNINLDPVYHFISKSYHYKGQIGLLTFQRPKKKENNN
ncbi:hypothetical protein ElyMa_000339100 [Elysia marginata]|uniref:Uncharacterized protein n=1 Tax=Elysia marginata TaxID=1093978 RepID=A0AAV4FC87_9GAST|nr:hypothetical protein ElyMa_000339100 [Elysia marginata]